MRKPSAGRALGRLALGALLALGCSRTVLETGSAPGSRPSPPDLSVVDGILPPPDATPGPDGGGLPEGGVSDGALPDGMPGDGALPDGGSDDASMEDLGMPDLGPPALCDIVRPRACGGGPGQLPCVVAQLGATEGTACTYQAYAAAVACVPGASLQLLGLDLLARERSLFAPDDAALLSGAAAFGLRDGLLSAPVPGDCAGLDDADVAALDRLFQSLLYLITEGRQTAARLARAPDASARSIVGRLEGGEGLKVYFVPDTATLRYVDAMRRVQRANITRPNVRVTIGRGDARSVVHVIDAFVPAPNLFDVMLLEGLGRLVEAMDAASPAIVGGMPLPLADGLEEPDRFQTVFGPSDAAFVALGPLPAPDALRDRLLYHSNQGVRGFSAGGPSAHADHARRQHGHHRPRRHAGARDRRRGDRRGGDG